MNRPTVSPVSVMEALEQRALFSVDPTITGVLPATLVATVKNTTSVTLTLTNSGAVPAKGPYTIRLFASVDQTLDPSDTLISTTAKTLASLKAGAGRSMKFKLGTVPVVPTDGAYFILADITGAINGGVDSVSASAGTVAIANPFIDLSDTVAITAPAAGRTVTPGKPFTLTVDVTNHGNVTATGPLAIDIGRSLSAAGTTPTDEGITAKTVKILPGKTDVIKLTRNVPVDVSLGSYFYVATIDPSAAFANTDLTDNVAITATSLGVVSAFPNIIGVLTGPGKIIAGADAGQTGTLSFNFATENQANGTVQGSGTLTGVGSVDSAFSVSAKISAGGILSGEVIGFEDTTDSLAARLVGDILTGTIVSGDKGGESVSFSLML